MAPAECSVRSMAHVCSPLAPWFLQVRKLSIYIQRRYILRCGNFLQRPFAYHGKPRERLKSRPPTFPFLLLASGAGIELITPWLRLRRRSRLTDQQMPGDRRGRAQLCRIERVGGRQTVFRTSTNMTTTPIAEVSDLQDPHAGDPSPAGLADGLWSRGELRGAVAPCSRRAASRVAGRSSGSPQRSAPSSISAASFRPPSSCADYSRGLTTRRRPGNLPRP